MRARNFEADSTPSPAPPPRERAAGRHQASRRLEPIPESWSPRRKIPEGRSCVPVESFPIRQSEEWPTGSPCGFLNHGKVAGRTQSQAGPRPASGRNRTQSRSAHAPGTRPERSQFPRRLESERRPSGSRQVRLQIACSSEVRTTTSRAKPAAASPESRVVASKTARTKPIRPAMAQAEFRANEANPRRSSLGGKRRERSRCLFSPDSGVRTRAGAIGRGA